METGVIVGILILILIVGIVAMMRSFSNGAVRRNGGVTNNEQLITKILQDISTSLVKSLSIQDVQIDRLDAIVIAQEKILDRVDPRKSSLGQ